MIKYHSPVEAELRLALLDISRNGSIQVKYTGQDLAVGGDVEGQRPRRRDTHGMPNLRANYTHVRVRAESGKQRNGEQKDRLLAWAYSFRLIRIGPSHVVEDGVRK